MLHRLLSELYEIPGYIYAVLAVATVTAWGVLIAYFRERRAFRVLCGMIAAVTVIGILCITVLFRSEQESGLILRPFAVFALAAQYSDVYNQMVLNVMLFVPLGMALPSVWPKRRKHPLVMTMLSGVSLSVLVEILQWLLSRGYTELDDVMLNTIGTAVGLLSYAVAAQLRKGDNRIENT